MFPNRRASKRFGDISLDTINAAIQKQFKLGKMPIEHFTVHDLRRTCRTCRTCRSLMASEGVPGHVAERCLNNKLKGVEGIYDRYDYFDERYEALAKIANRLEHLIGRILNSCYKRQYLSTSLPIYEKFSLVLPSTSPGKIRRVLAPRSTRS